MAVSPKEFRSLLEARQSIRFFDASRAVSAENIEEIIDDAQQAPNDCNHQSWKFIVITDPALREKLVTAAGSCEPARRASALIVPVIEAGWNHNKFSIIQTLAAATHTLILSAQTRGIASVWMAGIGNSDVIRELLRIPQAYIIDCFVGLGYAEAERLPWPKPPRQPVKKIYSLNRFQFEEDATYPMRSAERYDFWKISNQRNPYALWRPKEWTLRQIAFFRGNAVWANSPSPSLHKSRRFASEFQQEVALAAQHLRNGRTLVMLPYSGAYSAALLKAVPDAELTHFELSQNHEPMLKKRMQEEGIKKAPPFVADCELRVPLPAHSFENILIFQCLEILPEPERLLAEAERLLAKRGRLFITCRNKWSWFFFTFLLTTRKETVWNFGPYWPLGAGKLRRMLGRTFTGAFWGISPLPTKIGRLVKKWPLNFLSRLVVFIGEKA
ncbi:MAG: nitroreductase family protein [Patescibacteria group bacterium]